MKERTKEKMSAQVAEWPARSLTTIRTFDGRFTARECLSTLGKHTWSYSLRKGLITADMLAHQPTLASLTTVAATVLHNACC